VGVMAAFGWEDYHLFAFEFDDCIVDIPDPEFDDMYQVKVPVRIPQSNDTGRKINYLSTEELAERCFKLQARASALLKMIYMWQLPVCLDLIEQVMVRN
jgi:hypothetical protein